MSAPVCKLCRKRPALFLYRRVVKHDKQHDICMQCFRSISEHNKQCQVTR